MKHPASQWQKLSIRNTRIMRAIYFSVEHLPLLLFTHACTFVLGAATYVIFYYFLLLCMPLISMHDCVNICFIPNFSYISCKSLLLFNWNTLWHGLQRLSLYLLLFHVCLFIVFHWFVYAYVYARIRLPVLERFSRLKTNIALGGNKISFFYDF